MDIPVDVVLNHLGSNATYTKGATTKTIKAIYYRPYEPIDMGETIVQNAAPVAHVQTSDVTGVDRTATLTISGTTYKISEVRDQGTGITELILTLDT